MGANEQGAGAVHGRWVTIPRTLCLVFDGDSVLLMKRSPHRRIFPNRYNGVGGHIERGEDPMSAARREIMEETGLEVTNLVLRGVHNIDVGEATGIMMFVFTAEALSRDFDDPGEEGKLHWVKTSRLPELDLVEDLPILLPRLKKMGPNDPPYFAHVSYDVTDTIQIEFSGEGAR